MRKFMTMVAAAAFALATLAPVDASAQRYRHHDRGTDAYGCRNDNNYGCERDRDRRIAHNGGGYGGYDSGYGNGYSNRDECYDRQGRNHCYDRHDDNDDAVAAGVIGLVLGAVVATAIANGNDRRDDGYDDRDYRDDDGYNRDSRCMQQTRRWDSRSQRYVIVNVPC